MVAGGTVADGLLEAANRRGDAGAAAAFAGIIVGAVGLAVFAFGLSPKRPNRNSPD
jgi:hypothetical protein